MSFCVAEVRRDRKVTERLEQTKRHGPPLSVQRKRLKQGKIKWLAQDHTAGRWQPGPNAGLLTLIHYNTLASHNPSSEWLSGFGTWPISTQITAENTHNMKIRCHATPSFRPHQATESEGKQSLKYYYIKIYTYLLFNVFLLLSTHSLPILPPPCPKPPSPAPLVSVYGIYQDERLAQSKVGSMVKRLQWVGVIQTLCWDNSVTWVFFWTYPAETSQPHPPQHKNQAHTRPHCSQLHPGKHNTTTFLYVSGHRMDAGSFLSKAAPILPINGAGWEKGKKWTERMKVCFFGDGFSITEYFKWTDRTSNALIFKYIYAPRVNVAEILKSSLQCGIVCPSVSHIIGH